MGNTGDTAQLVVQARDGDQQAFARLYSGYGRLIYSIVRHMVGDDETAADLTQETFIKAWRSLHRLKEPAAFGGWLRMIALNLTRDHVRGHRPTEPLESDDGDENPRQWADDGAGPDEQLTVAEQQSYVREAVMRLNEEQRVVIVMHHLEGTPVAEIATTLAIPVGTVLSRLARGRDALKRKLSPYL